METNDWLEVLAEAETERRGRVKRAGVATPVLLGSLRQAFDIEIERFNRKFGTTRVSMMLNNSGKSFLRVFYSDQSENNPQAHLSVDPTAPALVCVFSNVQRNNEKFQLVLDDQNTLRCVAEPSFVLVRVLAPILFPELLAYPIMLRYLNG